MPPKTIKKKSSLKSKTPRSPGSARTTRKKDEKSVRDLCDFLRQVIDIDPHFIFAKDRDGRFTLVNQAVANAYGTTIEDLIGKTDADFNPNRTEVEFFIQVDREVMDSKKERFIPEEIITDAAGKKRWLQTIKRPIIGMDGRANQVLGVSTDITARKRAEEELRLVHDELEHRIAERTTELSRSNERLQAEIAERKQAEEALRFAKFSIERAADAVYWVDPQAKILDVNEAASLMLGYSKDELCTMTVHDLNPDFQADMWPEFWADSQRRGTMVLETFHRANNGRLIPIEVSVNYLSYEGKEYHCAFVRNITERKQAEEVLRQRQRALQSSQAQLQDLTSRLLTAQDSERQRIARDLHDDFSQRLTALTLDVVSLQRHPPLLPELLGNALEPVRKELEQLTSDLHDLAYRLHPPLLRHAGLQAAIEDHIHKAIERTELSISLKAKDVPSSIPLEWSLCLFRVFQESLQNIVKHAKATAVLVKLSGSSKGVGLSVIDNGKGFDEHDKSGHQKGLGLISMRERLRLLNGFLNIHSRPADGTKVCAWIPFQEQAP